MATGGFGLQTRYRFKRYVGRPVVQTRDFVQLLDGEKKSRLEVVLFLRGLRRGVSGLHGLSDNGWDRVAARWILSELWHGIRLDR